MSKNRRVLNLTRNFYLKLGAAQRAVEECSAVWVEPGVSIRSLSIAEAIAARNVQAANREPLPYAELHGIKYQPAVNGIVATRNEGRLTMDAHLFVIGA